MRNFLLAALLIGMWSNWGRIERLFDDQPAISANTTDVVLYATSWCGYCHKTRELLKREGVAYIEFDIETSAEGRRRYQALDGEGVPVLDVHGKVIHGYAESEMLAALRR
jgi:glutaredoxin